MIICFLEKYINKNIFSYFMKRRVIELGKNCLVVSLPTKWAQEFNLKKGDDVNIEKKRFWPGYYYPSRAADSQRRAGCKGAGHFIKKKYSCYVQGWI